MSEQIESIVFPRAWPRGPYGIVSILGLILASVGLGGVTAYSVNRRRRDIGIRTALGARPANVLALVMKEGIALIAAQQHRWLRVRLGGDAHPFGLNGIDVAYP